MNMINIQTFLRVVCCSSLTQAANELFVSQPTVTARLQQLEEEVGAVLIRRGKGVRALELTPQGMAFLPLAQRWAALETETNQFCTHSVQLPLSIACLDSVNLYVLRPLFRELTRQHPELRLNIRTHQSHEIFSLVEAHEVDFGFSYMLSRYHNVTCHRLFSEPLVLITGTDTELTENAVDYRGLNPALEIYVSWSEEFDLWHNDCWSPLIQPLVQADLASMIPLYLDHPGSWAICPISAARAFQQQGTPIRLWKSLQPLPRRTCYLLTHRGRDFTGNEAAAIFSGALRQFLQQSAWLEAEPST